MDHPGEFEGVTTSVAAGGAGVVRGDDGMVVFVDGALPGERVRIRVDERRRRHARGHVTGIIEPSLSRVESPCPHVADGCGGCDWLHVSPAAQPQLRATIVSDALERIGRFPSPPVRIDVRPSTAGGHRTMVRAAVVDGRAGIRRRRTHEPIRHLSCMAAHPLAEELLVEGRYGEATQVTIRVGATSGERMIVVSPRAADVVVPDDVTVVGDDELRGGRRVWIHDEVAGRTWRISARSFFQSNPSAAERLVDIVSAAVDGVGPGPLVDLYSGVGLFAGTVGTERPVVAVERGASSVADLRVNLADRGAPTTIVRASVEEWKPSTAAVVVADPARDGLGAAATASIVGTAASRIVLVSCDAGALGRDARLICDGGYSLSSSTLVEMFPLTSNVEVVSVFDRSPAAGN